MNRVIKRVTLFN